MNESVAATRVGQTSPLYAPLSHTYSPINGSLLSFTGYPNPLFVADEFPHRSVLKQVSLAIAAMSRSKARPKSLRGGIRAAIRSLLISSALGSGISLVQNTTMSAPSRSTGLRSGSKIGLVIGSRLSRWSRFSLTAPCPARRRALPGTCWGITRLINVPVLVVTAITITALLLAVDTTEAKDG
ncbi:hypothetical protein SAMN05421504_112208 [Amycolatopsis xylanica]|uniref:Uncharacterized protein n=1 Tax=Amycolatopsis xylanica TaxID=589385 RepID=A0A1H3S3W4_9PSEU|nr:hypothetical protein SAMN05421504_112208 [Amycolatopsis xylanica]